MFGEEPTHRIHRACRIGPLLSIQRHLISYNQLVHKKRFKEHSNSKLNQVVQCWWNYTCKLHCCVDGSNSIWLPWTLHITRGTVLAFIFSQAQGRQEQKQPQNGIKWEWAKWNIKKIKVWHIGEKVTQTKNSYRNSIAQCFVFWVKNSRTYDLLYPFSKCPWLFIYKATFV